MTDMLLGQAAFATSLAAAAVLGGFLVAAPVLDGFAFWPPPRERSWQDYAFWGLFRPHCLGIALTAFLDSGSFDWEHWTRLAIGIPVLGFFLGLTLYGYGFLGLDNTYGRRAGLVTDGIYALTRNPQYVASVAATAGLSIPEQEGATRGSVLGSGAKFVQSEGFPAESVPDMVGFEEGSTTCCRNPS